MLCKVTLLYANGIRIPNASKSFPSHVGEFSMGRMRHPVLSREVMHAGLCVSESGNQHRQAAEIIDAQLVCVSASGMTFRGFEVSGSGVEYAQEWFVQPITGKCAESDAHGNLPGLQG